MIISALFPIYIGAHASLSCPPSANKPEKRENKYGLQDDDDDEIDTPSDAIVFPIMAGLVLSGLYLLIKWLDDPKLLNRALNLYLSFVGVIGVSRLATDSLNVVTTFIFPSFWSTKKEIFLVDVPSESEITSSNPRQAQSNLKLINRNRNPFPGPFSSIGFSSSMLSKIWFFRSLLMKRWILRGYIQNTYHASHRVRLSDLLGFIFGFLVLFGLFLYDIIMVFYTPLMVTVASSLDVPIKLIIPGPGRGSMLGLGDIVLPGIMVALALRFDLHLHYVRMQKQASPDANGSIRVLKPNYLEATGTWGERFWSSGLDSKLTNETSFYAGQFHKVYFWISMAGYVLGLIVTLTVLNITKHAQPALLYLVPGVLGMLWGAAWIRGDLPIMWEYTEDGVWGTDTLVDNKEKSRVQGGQDEKSMFVFGTNSHENDAKVTNFTEPCKKFEEVELFTVRIFLLIKLPLEFLDGKIAKADEGTGYIHRQSHAQKNKSHRIKPVLWPTHDRNTAISNSKKVLQNESNQIEKWNYFQVKARK
ncbi:peptidase A22B family [Blumeria hordei DH14]|uniref:Peptidase A22B family n=1 Tax=Blumeria graminis f. sp. hordei (strain DH14) TaxID=546991 RepID=N1J5S7_BLUG1|nr:peptidase A22B family [Blumeria hordei DH14]